MIFRKFTLLMALTGAVALGGCQMNNTDTHYAAFKPEELHPIEVVPGKSRVTIPVTRSGRLGDKDEMLVRRFGAEVAAMPNTVVIVRPAGMAGEMAAARVAALLKDQGVAPQRIRLLVNNKKKNRTLIISTNRKFAVTRECGNWSKSITSTMDNQVYPNFGCAQQHNMAAMVANPEALEHPRPMKGPSAESKRSNPFSGLIIPLP